MKIFIKLFVIISYFLQFGECQQPTINNSSNCFDENINCKFWASENECQLNPDWMLFHCRLSCRNCKTEPLNKNLKHFAPHDLSDDDDICNTRIQTIEIPTRIVPTGTEFRDRAFQSGCAIKNQNNICGQNVCYHKRYRTIDGSCNNLKRPIRGAAYSSYARMLSPNYEDGIDRMIGTTPGQRPNPRKITHLILSTRVAIPTPLNGIMMMFGQFFSHDVTRMTMINFCTCSTIASQCANIPIPLHDIKQGECIPFTRAIPLCNTGPTGNIPRTQVNENTAFVDASQIYASDPHTARKLRVGSLIRTSNTERFVFPPRSGKDNILVGDSRANLFVGLAAMHTLFVRLHNSIAMSLIRLNRHWDEERTYQETRSIVAGIMQVITYQEYLPLLLGNRSSILIPPYTGYNPKVEPAISVEFSGAAFRLHGMIQEFYRLVNKVFQSVAEIRFVDGTGKVQQLLNTGTDLLVRGMLTIATKKPQRLTTQITEDLFGLSDMGSLNIQRGRDIGLMNYNAYRKLCGLPRLTNFNDWKEVSNRDVRRRVSALYGGNPNFVDLYVGGMLEEPKNEALVGPTFSCIIADQMVRLRDGDRFFYKNPNQFSKTQIDAISRVTMSRVICDTGEDFTEVPVNAFLVDNGANFVPCSQIPALDLLPWKE